MMTYLRCQIRSLVRDEQGATMVEYGLIAALIALAAIAVLSTMGENIVAKLREISDTISGAGQK